MPHRLIVPGILLALAGGLAAPSLATQDPASCPAHQEHATAPSSPSPYVAHQDRPIKALSADEIEGLLAGKGMGMALPAELNGYPGPKHVLEMAADLELTPEERRRVEASFEAMALKARQLGQAIVDAERDLDRLFASRDIDHESLAEAVRALAKLRGELRLAHLDAHLETTAALSPDRREKYIEERGYSAYDIVSAEAQPGHANSAALPLRP